MREDKGKWEVTRERNKKEEDDDDEERRLRRKEQSYGRFSLPSFPRLILRWEGHYRVGTLNFKLEVEDRNAYRS
ncbi:hypothetical protein M0804_011857 [Polistes exclamans]|nr:hypothetical protein M0804_011857 [Polistes exclamans]